MAGQQIDLNSKSAPSHLQTGPTAASRALGTTNCRIRVHINLGVALFRTGAAEAAREEWRKALDYIPDDPTALANLASVESMLGNDKEAFRLADRVIAIDPGSGVAWTVRINLADSLNDLEDLPASVCADRGIVHALATAHVRFGDLAGARELIFEAMRGGRREADLLLHAAEILYLEDRRDNVGDILRLADEAARLLERTELNQLRARALVLRGLARYFLYGSESSLDDFRAARDIAPGLWQPHFALAQVLAEMGEKHRAMGELEEIAPDDQNVEIVALKARLLAAVGRPDAARAEIVHGVERFIGQDDESVVLTFVEVAAEAGLIPFARDLLGRDFSRRVSYRVNRIKAELAAIEGNRPEAVALYERAIENAPAEAVADIQLAFARRLTQWKQYDRAISLYEGAHALEQSDEVQRDYLRTLYSAGRLVTTAALLQQIAQPGEGRAWVHDLGARLALAREDLTGAISHLTALRAVRPNNVDAAVDLALCFLRKGDSIAARGVVDEVSTLPILKGFDLIRLAELLVRLGDLTRALDLAYAAYRADPDDRDIQAAYVNIFLRRESPSEMDVDRVGPNTCVKLLDVDGGEEREYLILESGPVDSRRNEFLPGSEIGSKLIGLVPEEAVTFAGGTLSEVTFKVVEITRHYVHAFREILLTHAKRFPESAALRSFAVKGEVADFAPIIASLEQQSKTREEALEVYRERGFPLGAIACLIGEEAGNLYAYLVGRPDCPIQVEFGDSAGRERAVHAATEAEAVVVTSTGLTTAQELNLLELVAGRYPRLLAAQSLLDKIGEEIADAEQYVRRGGQHGLIKTEDGLARQEVGVERLEVRLDYLIRLRGWIKETCEIIPLPVEVLEPNAQRLREILGEESFDAYAIARAEKASLYADDLGLRRLLADGSGSEGFSTTALVEAALREGRSDRAEAARLQIRLIRLNHSYISVSTEVLFRAVADAGFVATPEVIRVFDKLRGPTTEAISALGVGVNLLKIVALDPIAGAALEGVAELTFECLLDSRPVRPTAALIGRMIQSAFGLLPELQDKLLERLESALTRRITIVGPME